MLGIRGPRLCETLTPLSRGPFKGSGTTTLLKQVSAQQCHQMALRWCFPCPNCELATSNALFATFKKSDFKFVDKLTCMFNNHADVLVRSSWMQTSLIIGSSVLVSSNGKSVTATPASENDWGRIYISLSATFFACGGGYICERRLLAENYGETQRTSPQNDESTRRREDRLPVV